MDTVEALLPGVWDSMAVLTAVDPYAPDPEMPKAQSDPRTLNDKAVMVADVQAAWAACGLPLEERQALVITCYLQEGTRTAAALMGCRYSTAAAAKEDGLQRLLHYLNHRTLC